MTNLETMPQTFGEYDITEQMMAEAIANYMAAKELLPNSGFDKIAEIADRNLSKAMEALGENGANVVISAIALTSGLVGTAVSHEATPAPRPITVEHVINLPESLTAVAEQYKTTPEVIVESNHLPESYLTDPNATIAPGIVKVTVNNESSTPIVPQSTTTSSTEAPSTTTSIPESTTTTSTPENNVINNQIYVVGDSLSVGMEEGGLQGLLSSNGWNINKIEATVGDSVADAIPKVNADAAQLKTAGSVVVELGTNDCMLYASPSCESTPEFESQIEDMNNAIRAINPNAKIFWVNTFTTKGPEYESINQAIDNMSGPMNYRVINWANEVQSNPGKYSFDPELGVHQTTTRGYQNMAEFIAEQIGKAPVPTPTTTTTTEPAPAPTTTTTAPKPAPAPAAVPLDPNSLQNVHNQLVDWGLSEAGADGVEGNMEAESGLTNSGDLEPERLENTVSGVSTPYQDIPTYDIENPQMGYGLVQWTPIQSKLGQFAATYHLDPNSEGTQIMYLETELKEMPRLLDDLRNPHFSPQEEAEIFEVRYERPASLDDAHTREAFAATISSHINTPIPAPTPVPAPAPSTTTTTAPTPTTTTTSTPTTTTTSPKSTTTTTVQSKPTPIMPTGNVKQKTGVSRNFKPHHDLNSQN